MSFKYDLKKCNYYKLNNHQKNEDTFIYFDNLVYRTMSCQL